MSKYPPEAFDNDFPPDKDAGNKRYSKDHQARQDDYVRQLEANRAPAKKPKDSSASE
jgi:hypothetical protein